MIVGGGGFGGGSLLPPPPAPTPVPPAIDAQDVAKPAEIPPRPKTKNTPDPTRSHRAPRPPSTPLTEEASGCSTRGPADVLSLWMLLFVIIVMRRLKTL